MDFGPHSAFILAAYGAAALAVAALILWVVLDHRAQRRALAALEAQGIVRRSSRVAEDAC
jgi:heme exporter protein D